MNHTSTANGTDTGLEVSTQAVEAEIRDRADPRQVLADRVAQLYRQMPIAIGATFIAGGIATFELQGRWLKELVYIWWAIVVTFSAAASLLLYAYYRSADKVDGAPQWLRWVGIAALGNGASWGLAGGVFFRSLSDEQQVFLAFLFAGMASVGIPVYAASWPIFALYAAGILGPFFYVLLTFGNRLFVEIALLVPLFYAINVAIAYRLTQVFHSGYRLRHAYGKLTQDHRAAEPAPGKAAGRARGSAPPGRGERPQARPVRRACADRGARAAARRHGGRGERRRGDPVRLRRLRAGRRTAEEAGGA